jgi:cytoskeletal protein RodZ
MSNHLDFPDLLRNMREQRNMSIEELAEQSKIFPYYLKIFEKGEKEKFPPYSISKGYIKIVARELDVDPDILLKSFDEFVQEKKDVVVHETDILSKSKEKREKILKERKIKSIRYIITFVLIVLVFIMSIYFIHQIVTKKSPIVSKLPNKVVTQEPTNNEPNNNSQKIIYMKFTGKSWVLVKDQTQNKILFEGIINPGEEKVFSTNDTLDIKLGNAGGVEISKDGKNWFKAGNVGEVVELTE